MKPIIAVDFDGTLVKNQAANEAHIEWFDIMSSALGDKSVKKYASVKDYFPHVYEVMSRYTGLDAKREPELLRRFARNLFQMSMIGRANQLKDTLAFEDFVKYLKSLKKKYRLALVTTSPEDTVRPILEIIKCDKLFDLVYQSPLVKEPDKKELLEEFVKENGKPVCYIGNEGDDMLACKDLGLVGIMVVWDKNGDEENRDAANYVVEDVEGLKGVIEGL